MRNGVLLSMVCLTACVAFTPAQEPVLPRVPQPVAVAPDAPQVLQTPPQPAPSAPDAPQVLSTPPQPVPQGSAVPPPYPPPGNYPPPGSYPYPPPGAYPYPPPGPYPYPPPRVAVPPVGQAFNPYFWLGLDGLGWWVKNQPLSVPVITTGPASQGTSAGNLGVPGTTAIRSPLEYGFGGGFRASFGGWFDDAQLFGAEGSLFFMQQQSAGFGAYDRSGVGNFVINEPLANAPYSTQVSSPGLYSGGAWVNTTTRLSGGDLNALYSLYRGEGWDIRLVGGFRFIELDESLTITNSSTLLVPTTYVDNFGNVLVAAPAGSSASVLDSFSTRNQFYGGQVGASFERDWGPWFISGVAKLAVGDSHEVITVNGNTLVSPVNGTPVPLQGGNYALGTNSGRYSMDRFAIVPEGQLNIGYQFTPRLRASVGYNFLWWSNVARPGNQIDNSYDGVTHPLVPMASSSFWAQGLTFSVQFRF